jgi:hypothetical protein
MQNLFTRRTTGVLRALAVTLVPAALLALPVVASADAQCGLNCFTNPLGKNTDLIKLIKKMVDILIQIGAVIVVLYFVYAGFLMVTANGDAKQIGQAKDAALYCVIGGLILLGAQLIITVMESTVAQLK